MNKTQKLLVLAVLVALLIPSLALGATGGHRYFVKSSSAFWKNAFNARHEFQDGFTADLNDWQIRFGKFLRITIEPVAVLQILPEMTAVDSASVEAKKDKPAPIEKPTERSLPADQTSWGMEYIYQDSFLAKTEGGADVKVAVLDTGVNISHPDLQSRVAECTDFTNVRFSVLDGKCEDKNGHGTHVSGIIAADGGSDGLGIYGVAPEALLLAYRVCSATGSCYADDVAIAIKTAVERGANIINLSLGSDKPISFITNAIDYAAANDVLIVAAAGNDGPYFASLDYPAAQSSVVAVGAIWTDRQVEDWSSRGGNSKTIPWLVEDGDIEFAAPGSNIESTWKNGGYALLSGTSMAAPFVSGLAAKYWSRFTLTEEELAARPEYGQAAALREFLQKGALDIDVGGDDDASGFGFPRVEIPEMLP